MNLQRIAVFIDNSNVFKNIQRIKKIDNKWISFYNPLKLAQKLSGNRKLVSVKFYCVHPPVYLLEEDEKHKEKYNITNKYYSTIEKLPLVEVKYGDLKGIKGALREKNVDTQIVTNMVTEAALNKYDTAILVSNDGDFISAIESIKMFNKKIETVFFRGSISENLKKLSDITRRARRSYFQPLDLLKIDLRENE